MAVDLNTMASNIQTILAGVPGILSAFDYEPQSIPQLPAATLYFDGFSENEETIGRLQYDWKWTIRVYIALSQSDVGPPQLQLRTLTQDVLTQFRTTDNLTLNNSCLYSSISNGDVYNILNATNPMMVIEFTLIATTQESR
jgi:hypothetical protein